MSATLSATPPTSTRFGRLERRGLLLGLSLAQLIVLATALTIAVAAVYTAGMPGLLVSAPVWLPLVGAGTVTVRDRSIVQWVPLVAEWGTRRLVGATIATTRLDRRPAPTVLDLPGVRGGLRVIDAPALGGALIHDRAAGTVTGVLRVDGLGFLLDDGATQDHKVAQWGRVLASLCQQAAVVRIQVLHRNLPGGGDPVRRWWTEHALAGAPWPTRIVADLVSRSESTSQRQESLVAIALKVPRGSGRVLTDSGVGGIERQLASLGEALAGAELRISGWADDSSLRWAIRSSYDPHGAAHAQGADAAARPSVPGPMGIAEHWTHLSTDTAVHAVYWIAEWPRSEVHPGFLQPLVLASGAQRTVTVVAEPMPSGRALREIRRAKAEHAADSAQRARTGQIEDESTRAEVSELLRREQDLVAGHGDLSFTGLVTVTASSLVELEAACAATESAAAQAMCELRRLVGQQALAHLAAAVPVARGLR
ncbi:MAG: SCO6880 family protein [Cellulomonas sp.]